MTYGIVAREEPTRGGRGLALTESAFLTKAKVVAEAKALFQPLQAKDVVTHRLVGEALGGGGPAPAAECVLLTMKKKPANPDALLQLLQVENVIAQLVYQAAVASIGFIAVATSICLLTQPRTLFFFKPALATPLKFTAHADELAEVEVATFGCKELLPGFIQHANKLGKAWRSGGRRIPQSGIG
jgi:hypothetical protein